MMLEIKAPSFPESISDGTVATWHKKVGEAVLRDEVLVDIETDKVVMEVVAPADGRLSEILKPEGETVLSTELIGLFEAGSALTGTQPSAEPPAAAAAQSQQPLVNPAARRLVQAHGLTPEQIAATGKGGVSPRAMCCSISNRVSRRRNRYRLFLPPPRRVPSNRLSWPSRVRGSKSAYR